MVGYNVDDHDTSQPVAWGHLPNGGTVANLEAMWAARSVKFNGLTIQKMLQEKQEVSPAMKHTHDNFTYKTLSGDNQNISSASAWDLLNIPIDEGIDLFDKIVDFINTQEKELGTENLTSFDEIFKWVQEYTLEELGGLGFYEKFRDELTDVTSVTGKWFCPGSRHYSWDKGANILGIGRQNMCKIPVDINCRMDPDLLKQELQKCLDNRIPVIGVTVVFGTTQEGAVDDLQQILKIRKYFEEKGLTFYIHIDGAWGGYFASCIERSQTRHHKFSATVNSQQSVIFQDLNLSDHFQI